MFCVGLQAQDFPAPGLRVTDLRCEYRIAPIGIAEPAPALSWQLQSGKRNVTQTAYRILVADRQELLEKNTGNIWDSEKVMSAASIQVKYAGKPLEAARTYYWKLMVWDNQGQTSAWSTPTRWQMGLPAKEDWKQAQWIAYNAIPDSLINPLPIDGAKDKGRNNNILPLLRREFTINKPVAKATVFISGLGHFEMHLNGEKAGDHFLDPGWTKYDREALYVGFDVTAALKPGANALGVLLGNGFYYIPAIKERYRKLRSAFGYPKMICRLVLEYEDGSTENIVSDDRWKACPGPIRFSSIFGGEDYDARLEQPGWDAPAFNDRSWQQALVVEGPPVLNPQMAEPLKVFENFSPVKVTGLKNGDWVYDLGQNASGIISLKVQGNRGDTVRIYPGELLTSEGAVSQRSSGGPYYFQYILKGGDTETWQPRFIYYGFRYLQVKGIESAGSPGIAGRNLSDSRGTAEHAYLLEIKGLHTRNAAAGVGGFSCSDTLFNRIYTLIDWAIRSNMASVFTDCPHREKLGWLEEVHLMGSSIRYNYDIANLAKKTVTDMQYSQLPNGLVPEIAPEYVHFTWGGNMFRDSPEWGSSSIIVPWYLYKWYGDARVLAQAYPMMQQYIQYLQTQSKNHILSQGLGDWYDLGPKPPGVSQLTTMGVTGTAIYYYDLTILEQIARKLNKAVDAAHYKQLAAQVKKAFNETFFNKKTRQYATGSQTSNAMAIFMGLVEPRYKASVLENLIKDIQSRDNALTAGDIGYRYVLRVLEAAGRSDVIYDMNSRSDVPGYGFQLAKGATSLTESWQATAVNSNNHLMLGHLMEWFYSGLCGIREEEGSIAFSHIKIHPEPVGDIQEAKGSYYSPYGLISSQWKKQDGHFELEVEVPPNTRAVIYLPVKKGRPPVYCNDQLLKKVVYRGGRAIIPVGSGHYTFTSVVD